MGSRSRLRHAYLDAVQARAEHAERTREEEARLRVTEERMRIARDLHDVVAHHMALANAQAGTAAHLLEPIPQLTKKILTDLQATTSSACSSCATRSASCARRASPDAETLEPAPGLAQLPDLLEVCRSAGLAVSLDDRGRAPGAAARGGPDRVPHHPGGPDQRHQVRRLRDRLADAFATAAPGSPSRSPTTPAPTTDRAATRHGYGIIGMRERAHAVGGDLRVTRRQRRRLRGRHRPAPLHPHAPGAATARHEQATP